MTTLSFQTLFMLNSIAYLGTMCSLPKHHEELRHAMFTELIYGLLTLLRVIHYLYANILKEVGGADQFQIYNNFKI